ncbi:MAG: outer membrane lipoprotein-sorting protein [Vicinamibacterales bacterium]
MRRMKPVLFLAAAPVLALVLGSAAHAAAGAPAPDAAAIVKRAIDYWRGRSSYTLMAMTVHRPDSERRSVTRAWTRGAKDALVRFMEPARDAGNATLKLGDDMWVFAPRLNRVVKIPFSMMASSWMGSDFSYNDLAKSDQLVVDFDNRLTGTETSDGHVVYVIEATPHRSAPVIWGKEVVKIRDDDLLLEQTFFDQDGRPVKRLSAQAIGMLGGRRAVTRLRMATLEAADEWTELDYRDARFDLALPDGLFTQSNLRNPRPEWERPPK